MIAVKNIADPLSPLARNAIESAQSFIPLKSLRHGFLEDLFLYVELQTVIAGQSVFEEGNVDYQYIYLSSGALNLEYSSGYVETLRAEDNLLPVVHIQPRPCRALAIEDSTVLRIDSDKLERTLSWSQMTDYVLSELSLDRENDGNLEWFQTILVSNLFFKVPSINAEQIFSKMSEVAVSAGESIITQGDLGDCCYFLKEGEAEVYKLDEQGQNQKVAEISPGRCFGEDALVEHKERNASISMKTDGLLMKLDKPDFLLLLKQPLIEEISAAEMDALSETPILIDVRTDAEYTQGHLAHSANIPLSLLSLKKRLLALEKPYVLYCDTGKRSDAAAFFLGKEGYNVLSLKGGLQEQNMLEHLVNDSAYILRDGELVIAN